MRGGFAPGDVAMVEYYGESPMVAVRVSKCSTTEHGVTDHWHTERGTWGCHPDTVRPLVVIDAEDREQVERLTAAIPPNGRPFVDEMQAALRSLVAPPKPPEPQGLGAVVESNDGLRWVRCEPDGGIAKWLLSQAPEHSDPRYVWSAVPAARVLSEGVTE